MSEAQLLKFLKGYRQKLDLVLDQKLPPAKLEPTELHTAMRYTVLEGGKYLRGALIYAAGVAFEANPKVLYEIGAGIEVLQASSLIIDDLPSFDNDTLRHGKVACHIKFGEMTAIMTIVALIALGYEILGGIKHNNKAHAYAGEIAALVARMMGSQGISGGQLIDTKLTLKKISLKKLNHIYDLKTGYAFSYGIKLAWLAGYKKHPKAFKHLFKFGQLIGLAYQIQDDIIGIESDTQTLGKYKGRDIGVKCNYPILIGMEKSKATVQKLYRKALQHLDKSGLNTDDLKLIASSIVHRKS